MRVPGEVQLKCSLVPGAAGTVTIALVPLSSALKVCYTPTDGPGAGMSCPPDHLALIQCQTGCQTSLQCLQQVHLQTSAAGRAAC